METIKLLKDTYDNDFYEKVIDREFTEFLPDGQAQAQTLPSIEEFFATYEEIFYNIPSEGDQNSHRYILEKTAQHLGVNISPDSIQALIDEVTSLRQQLVDSAQTTLNLNR